MKKQFTFKRGYNGEPYMYVGGIQSPSGWIVWEVGKDWLDKGDRAEAEKQLQNFLNQE